jgi:hypothetical protein
MNSNGLQKLFGSNLKINGGIRRPRNYYEIRIVLSLFYEGRRR